MLLFINDCIFITNVIYLFLIKNSCDADPTVLAQYIIALIGNENLDDALKASLQEKLNEFFDDRK